MGRMRAEATIKALSGLTAPLADPVGEGAGETFAFTPNAGVYGTAKKSVNVNATSGAGAARFAAPDIPAGPQPPESLIDQCGARSDARRSHAGGAKARFSR